MTEMIHDPASPPWYWRPPALAAVLLVLIVRLATPERRRMRTNAALASWTRWLPPADANHAHALYEAVVACQPRWWRGQIDCKERSLATVLACALTGQRCRLVYGARDLPAAFHSWVMAVDGTHVGNHEADGHDHPWTPVYITP